MAKKEHINVIEMTFERTQPPRVHVQQFVGEHEGRILLSFSKNHSTSACHLFAAYNRFPTNTFKPPSQQYFSANSKPIISLIIDAKSISILSLLFKSLSNFCSTLIFGRTKLRI